MEPGPTKIPCARQQWNPTLNVAQNATFRMGHPTVMYKSQQGKELYVMRRSNSAERTEEYFAVRARRADPAKIARILKRVGKGNPPIEGDELPPEFPAKKKRSK